jgi:hypothetical protein
LWGLDFMYWWEAHDAAGINFHTGDRVAAGSNLLPSKYTAYYTATNGYLIRPLGYGIKAFDLGSHGRFVPINISGSTNLNLTAYAVLGDDKNIYVTLVNKEHGTDAKDAIVNLALDAIGGDSTGSLPKAASAPSDAKGAYFLFHPFCASSRHAVTLYAKNPAGTHGKKFKIVAGEIIYLTAPGNDIAATSGVTLGGAEIKNDASWSGKWQVLPTPKKTPFPVKLPAATAAVLRLAPE